MRIPDGDLVPRRRHQYGGGYGRRRRLRNRRVVVVVLLLLVAGGLAFWFGRSDKPSVGATPPCPTPSASPQAAAPQLPQPAQVRLTLLNGTPRNGLALTVGNLLKARGFVVVTTGNASAAVAGPSVVTYGPGGLAAATLLAHHVAGGVRLANNPRAAAGAVALVLGSDFTRLATPAEVQAAGRAAAAPSASATPARSNCPA